MAEESGSGQEKTEEPSGRRLSKAREEGQVPRSRELNTLIMLLSAGFALMFLGPHIISGLLEMLRSSFVIDRAVIFNTEIVPALFLNKVGVAINYLMPFFLFMLIAAIAAPLPLSGWVFSTKALAPKLNRLDPIKGLRNKIFSWKGLVELLKALVKFVIVASVGYLLFQAKIGDFLALGHENLNSALSNMGVELIRVFILLSSSLIVIALVDVPFQLWDHKRQLKMTKQELKDEHKETEGSPEIKRRVRQTQYEMSTRRMMEAVPQADVVVTNPTHYAVALRYDQLRMSAPVVVAIGADLIALQIRRVADANEVPILEAPPLARALYHNSELNQEIPAGLYLAVAQVLAYIYQLKHYQSHGGVQPDAPGDLPIPDELRRN
jgi:flagellar biosynthetic protein FlhB